MRLASDTDVVIRRVRDVNGWMGNMSSYPLLYDGEVYPTAEHLFQALRFARGDHRAAIRAERSPMAAKMRAKALAKFHRLLVEPRTPQDVLNLKLEQRPDLRERLRETTDRKIVEDCTRRPTESGLFWGVKLVGGAWVGENWLGALWMAARGDEKPVW